ncbi:Metaxin [Schizosaccharomyces pombe]
MLQLFIYSPGLGQPTMDPGCLAALIYCALAVPKDEIEILRTANSGMSPTHKLPALWDGHVWIGSLKNILIYLKQKGYNLDNFDAKQLANVMAFTSLLEGSVNDLWLLEAFVNEENFVEAIRPAWSKALKFPHNYLTPNALQRQAKERLAQTLGIRDEEVSYEASRMPISHRWTNATRHRQALLRTQARRIRISSLARQVYGSLESLISDSKFIFGEKPTSLDCLFYAYLSFHAFTNELPQATLRPCLQFNSPKLYAYLKSLRETWFSDDSNILSPLSIKVQPENLLTIARLAWNNVTAKANDTRKSITKFSVPPERKLLWARNGFFIFASAFSFVWFVISNGIVVIETEDDEASFEEVDDAKESIQEKEIDETTESKATHDSSETSSSKELPKEEEKESSSFDLQPLSAQDLLFSGFAEDEIMDEEFGYDDDDDEEFDLDDLDDLEEEIV